MQQPTALDRRRDRLSTMTNEELRAHIVMFEDADKTLENVVYLEILYEEMIERGMAGRMT